MVSFYEAHGFKEFGRRSIANDQEGPLNAFCLVRKALNSPDRQINQMPLIDDSHHKDESRTH